MSSGMSCFRRASLLALVVIVSDCGQQPKELVLDPIPSSVIPRSPAESTITTVPTFIPSVPAPHGMSTSQQITTEFTQLIRIRVQCGQRPVSCPVSELTASGSKYHRYLTALMKFRAEANLATRPGAGKFRFRIDSIDLIGSFSAVVHTCIFDSLVVFDLGQSDSTRDDIVFDDDVISGHTAWQIVVDNGEWKWSDATSIDTNYGKDICRFAA